MKKVKIRIKKWLVFGGLGIIALSVGLFLLIVLLQSLDSYGIRGYLILAIFIVTTFIYLKYELDIRLKYRIADETAKKIVTESKKELDPDTLRETRRKLAEHLKKQIFNESWEISF